MKQKRTIRKKAYALLLTVALVLSNLVVSPSTAQAAGWLEYATQTITLGTAVSASIKNGDYYGSTELGSSSYYWHIYKFTMPKNGLLNVYLESFSENYLRYNYSSDGFVIFSASDPDTVVWRSKNNQNRIEKNYSASRDMYYGSTEIALEGGEYYFVVRQAYTINEPYSLTLSYKEPVINVSSITLTPGSVSMEIGAQKTLIPTVLPDNATDKTVTWQSSDPSVATVENGVVKAVSLGTTNITAISADGEIKATCPVTVICEHSYKTTVTPADMKNRGSVTEKCSKCGDESKTIIPKISSIKLSQTYFVYDGKKHQPEVTVTDEEGNVLKMGKDYSLSYPQNTTDVGEYALTLVFTGNYTGTQTQSYTIMPVPIESISLGSSDLTLNIGSEQKLEVTVLPDNATVKVVVWKTSDKEK